MSARSSIRTRAAAALVVALAACGDDASKAASSAPAVHVAISVDWEGAYMRTECFDALEQFRKDNPGVPITHMLNAAYYTKPQADAGEVTREVRLALKKGDETGLHIHAWKSLFDAAGVPPRAGPSFLHRSGEPVLVEGDAGFDVELGAYTVFELRAVMKKSREILDREKLPLGPSFRAAGWLAAPSVLEAARAEGFSIDLSAAPAVWFDDEGVDLLRERMAALWPEVEPGTQPYWIETAAGRILEMPNTGAMADYVTTDEIEQHVTRAAAGLTADRPVFVHLGFHVETADEFAPRLTLALAHLRQRKVPVVFETVSRSAELAQRMLEPKPK